MLALFSWAEAREIPGSWGEAGVKCEVGLATTGWNCHECCRFERGWRGVETVAAE